MRNLYSIALFTALVASAACGSDSKSAPATANAVIPADGFIGRHVRVEISGDNTTWTSAATVSFGDGITVGAVSLASPTDLFAEITISPTAAEGLRDVTITDGGVTTALTQAFSIANPVTIKLEGTIAQGSIGLFTITNHDFETPFDTTSTGDGFFTPLVFTNLAISSPAGTTFQLSNVAPYSASGTVFLDTTATSGPVTIMSGPAGGDIVTSPAPAVTVAARTATVLMPGMAAQATVAKAFDSSLFELDIPAGAATLTRVKTSTTSTTAKPIVVLLPASGAWADQVGSGASVAEVATSATKYYAITLDEQGNKGFAYSITAATAAMTVVNDTEPNNTVAQAQTAAAVPVLFTGTAGAATLTDDTDVDFIKITVPASKAVHVKTLPGDTKCDTVIDVLNAAGAMSLGGPSKDLVYLDDFTSTVVPSAGTYLVKISASQGGTFDPALNHYQAAIFFE